MRAIPWDEVHRPLLAGAAVVIVTWAVVSLSWPFGWDQGIFAWVGDTIVHGGMPYRDAWDVKGPVVYYVFAALQALVGKGAWSIRVFDLLLIAAALVPFYRLLRGLAGPLAARYGAVLAVLWYARMGYYHTAQPDGWVALLMMAALGLMLHTQAPRGRTAVILGLLIATSALLKPIYGLFLAIPVWHLARSPLAPRQRRRLLWLGALTFLGALGLTAIWFSAHGAFQDFFDAYIRFNLGHTQAQQAAQFRDVLIRLYNRTIADPAMLLAIPFAAFGLSTLWRRHRLAAETLVVWGLVTALCIAVQAGASWYRWHLVTPIIALLAGVGIAQAAQGRPEEASFRGPLIILLLGFSVLTPARDAFRFFRVQTGLLPRTVYETAFTTPFGGPSPFASVRLATMLKARTAPTDYLLIYDDPATLYHADRPTSGRYTFRIPLWAKVADPGRDVRIEEFLRDLKERPPRFIAMAQTDLLDNLLSDGRPNPSRVPALDNLLQSEYVREPSFEGFTVYRRLR